MVDFRKEWLRVDVIAGLTTAAVVIPKAMAYATIAGLPVQVGLYTALLPMAIYAVLGTSRPLSVSTTTTLAILTVTAFGEAPHGSGSIVQATATLTLLVGVILVAAAILRFGFVADFISEPVLVGFKAGLGVVIVVDQIPKILGIHVPHGSLVQNVVAIAHGLPSTSLPTLAVGVAMILLLTGIETFAPHAPAPLVVVALSIAGAALFRLEQHGVQLVGQIAQGMPPITLPSASLAARYWAPAAGIALMSFTETIAAGRAFAVAGEPAPRANRELVAVGAANIGGAFLGAMPAGGGTTQTAVNRHAGARSQFAELVTAGAALATMVFLAPLIALMPQATLAAVVIVYSITLIRPVEVRSILDVRRTEFFWAVAAFAGVMLLGTLKGIVVAIAVSLATLVHQVVDPPVYILGRKRGTNVFRARTDAHPDDETFTGLLILRVEGRLFFANVGQIGQKIRALIEQAKPRVVVLDCAAVPDLEYTALKTLTEAVTRQRGQGVAVWLVGLNPAVLTVVQRSPLGSLLGRECMHFNLEVAVAKYVKIAA